MTRNQVDYLSMEETKRNNIALAEEQSRHNAAVEAETNRNNLVIESQGSDRNAETKRNNIAMLKETKKHNRATEKQAKADNKARILTASKQVSASIANTQTTAAASRYATQVRAATEYAGQANQYVIASERNRTEEKIQKAKNATSKFLKKIDQLMKSDELTQKERQSLRDAYVKIKTSNDKLSADATQAELNRQAKMISSLGGLLGIISQSANQKDYVKAVNKKAKQIVSNKSNPKEIYPGVFLPTTGGSPASQKTSQGQRSKGKAKSHITINTKKKMAKKTSKKQRKKNSASYGWLKNPTAKVRSWIVK